MSAAERMRRYRARQRGQVEGNEPLRSDPKPDRYGQLLDGIRAIETALRCATEDEYRRLVADAVLDPVDDAPGAWRIEVDVEVPASLSAALQAVIDAEVQRATIEVARLDAEDADRAAL